VRLREHAVSLTFFLIFKSFSQSLLLRQRISCSVI